MLRRVAMTFGVGVAAGVAVVLLLLGEDLRVRLSAALIVGVVAAVLAWRSSADDGFR